MKKYQKVLLMSAAILTSAQCILGGGRSYGG